HRADLLSLAQQVRRHGRFRRTQAEGVGGGEREAEAVAGRAAADDRDAEGVLAGKMRTPVARRKLLRMAKDGGLSARAVCRQMGWSKRVADYTLRQPQKDAAVARCIVEASQRYPRFGYRRMAAWLQLGETRTRRLWRELGLQLPKRRPRCGSDI